MLGGSPGRFGCSGGSGSTSGGVSCMVLLLSLCDSSRVARPKYNRLMDRAARLSGDARYRAYGELDVQLSRDAAPAVPYALFNLFSFVSANVGCIILPPSLDLTAVCLT
jgi:hypothetical protein